ncbi:hypothetical protein BDC45DRAFT_504390 [Circinella umbellata]|nr:hypothetical protein BDC45DRAFT_504390 [Circinella umbellata]
MNASWRVCITLLLLLFTIVHLTHAAVIVVVSLFVLIIDIIVDIPLKLLVYAIKCK